MKHPIQPDPFRQTILTDSGRRHLCRLWLGLVLFLSGTATRAQSIVQEYYVPMPEAQIRQSFLTLASNTGTTLDTVISIVVGNGGTKVVYDHWEDGYEIDLNNPLQPTTEIWGDGDDSNGKPPGTSSDPASLEAGAVIALRNLVSLPRNPATRLYDGRDRVAATKAIILSRSAWPTSPGSVLADATEVSATIDWGDHFIMPIGEDEVFPTPSTNSMFEMVSLFVQASQNGTSIQIDKDADGVAETSLSLNQGEVFYVNRGVLKGATVTSTKPVQVHLLTGDIGANYESRWYAIPPTDQWGPSYFSPVGTASDGDDTYIFIYNPNPADAITVHFVTRVSHGSFSIPAKGSHRFLMPQDSAAHFLSDGNEPFFAIGAVGAEPSANNVHDWGFSLVPEGNLTTAAIVGWGPGTSDLSANGSPVWFTTVGATRVYVDYNGDKAGPQTDPEGDHYDVHYDVAPYQVTRVFDPDKDQTGMRVYTLDGTLLTAAWGQDPAVSGSGNPFLDMGTTVPAFPVPVIQKVSTVYNDVSPQGPSVGDTMEYTISMDNQSLIAMGNVLVFDGLPPQLQYVENSTTRDGVAVPDNTSPGTLFPLDEGGIVIPVIGRRQATVIKYRTQIVASGQITNNVGTSFYGVSASNTVPVSVGGTACALQFTDANGNVVSAYHAGDDIHVQLDEPDLNTDSGAVQTIGVLVSDSTSGDYEFALLTETGADTGVFRNIVGLPSSATAGLGQEDGTLHVAPGDSLSSQHLDSVHGETCSATATIIVPSLIKQLYLTSDDADDDISGGLDRIDPVASGDGTTSHTTILGAGSSGAITVVGAAASSNSGRTVSSHSFNYNSGSTGSDRILLVGISYRNNNSETVTSVTYNGLPLTQVGTQQRTVGSVPDGRIYIFRLLDPPAGTHALQVTWNSSLNEGSVIGAVTYAGVDQSSPTGTFASSVGTSSSPSVNVASSPDQLAFGVVGGRSTSSYAVTGGGTFLWSSRPYSGQTAGSGQSETASGSSVTLSWSGSNAEWVAGGVCLQPASAIGTPTATFTQTPSLAEDLVLPAGTTPGAEVFFTTASGTMPASPNIRAILRHGTTTLATSTAASSDGARLTFTFPAMAGTVVIPSGESLTLEVTTSQAGVAFTLDYDSLDTPSLITLPTTTVIHTNSLAVFDAPYPDGTSVGAAANGSALYVRATVGDPFGAHDITGLTLTIDGPGSAEDLALPLSNAHVVATTDSTKTYEFAWNTGSTTGAYTISSIAREGLEDSITSEKSTSISLSYLDLGTPSTSEFTAGLNGPATDTFGADEPVAVRVTDVDQNLDDLNTDTLTAVVASSSGDLETVLLTETGPNTGVFVGEIAASSLASGNASDGGLFAPPGASLSVSYTDPDDSGDASSDTAIVPPPVGVPGVSITKTLLAPSDGQALIGEDVQFRLRVVNIGNTTLTGVAVTDTFPAVNLGFVSSTLTPDAASAGTLTWNGIGPLAPGQSKDIVIVFHALASASPALTSAVADAGSGVTATTNASVLITHPGLIITSTIISPDPGPASKGEDVVLNIQLHNSGDTTITSLPVEDVFSAASFAYVAASPAPDAVGSGSLLWMNLAGAGLAPGADQAIQLTLRAVGAADPATSTVTVAYAQDEHGDPVPPATSTAAIQTISASIRGSVLEDNGAPGLDGNDTPLSGITVTLHSDPDGDGNPSDGSVLAITTTLADGSYEFLNLGTGHYVVEETDSIGFESVGDSVGGNDNRIAIHITTFTSHAGNDFLDVFINPADYGNITGRVRNDADGDGDPGDPDAGIAGVTIELYTDPNGDGSPADGVAFLMTTTDATGAYGFHLIPPGSYVVVETDPSGYSSTADITLPNDNRIASTVAASETSSGNDFLDSNNTATLANLGNLIWSDTNNDGLHQGTEPGIHGVTVQLFRATQTPGLDPPFMTAVTSAGGAYHFNGIPAGDYLVYLPASNFSAGRPLAAAPLSSVPTATSDDQVDEDDNGGQPSSGLPVTSPSIELAGGETDTTVDFGFVPTSSLGTIAGHVMADLNNNNTGDEPIPGVTVTLLSDPNGDGDPLDGVELDTATTALDGSYAFGSLPPAHYVVIESQPSGFMDVTDSDGGTDNQVSLLLTPAGTAAADFIEEAPGSISGLAFTDLDADGIRNGADTGQAWIGVALLDESGAFLTSTVTASDGTYAFSGLPPGDYLVVFITPDNHNPSPMDQGSDDTNDSDFVPGTGQTLPLHVMAGGELSHVDAGFIPQASVGDLVWNDLNGDGIRQGDEPGLPDITIELLSTAGSVLRSTVSNGDGWYDFAALNPGSYAIRVTPPAGMAATLQDQGISDSADSDLSPATLTTAPITLVAGESNATLDAGLVHTGQIGHLVWIDVDGDGVKGPSEAGVKDVFVDLYEDVNQDGLLDVDDTLIESVLSDAGGVFVFERLPSGHYLLSINDINHQLDGLMPTTSGTPLAVTLNAGEQHLNANFGYASPASLSGSVMVDVNIDGLPELPLAGVTVTLLDAQGEPVDADVAAPGLQVLATATGADGSYHFSGLRPGAYRVAESQPTGYASVSDSDGGDPDQIGDQTLIVITSGVSSSGHDFLEAADPSGYIYDVVTGQIIAGGSITVTGPGAVTILLDGSSGQYGFITDGTPGDYTITYAPPSGYVIDPLRAVAGPSFDPTGQPDPVILGSAESAGSSGYLTDASASANPYYLTFSLAPGDPVVIRNNLPLVEDKPRTWPAWQYRHPLGGQNSPSDNPDGDVHDNLQEFAFCFDPESGLQSGCPVDLSFDPVTGQADVVVRRVTGITGVSYTLEFIPSLAESPAGWADVTSINPSITHQPDGTELATYPDVGALAPGAGTLFFRVRVDLDADLNGSPEATTHTGAVGMATRQYLAQVETCSVPFVQCALFTGRINAVTGAALDVTTSVGSGSISAALTGAGECYVEVLSGGLEGHRFEVDESACTATSIAIVPAHARNTLDPPSAGLNGATICLRRHWTLDSTFDKSRMLATNNPGTADRMLAYNGTGYSIFWLFLNGGNPKWLLQDDASLTNYGTRVLDSSEGFFFHARGGSLTMTMHGHVRENAFACPLRAGSNLVGGGWPMDQSPAARNLTLAGGFMGSNNPGSADRFLIWKGDSGYGINGYQSHFLLNVPGHQHWTAEGDASLTSEDNLPVFEVMRASFIRCKADMPEFVMPTPWAP